MKRKCEWKDKHKDYGRSVWIRCENKPPIEGFCESLGVQDFSTIRNSTPKREKERNVFREHNSTIRNSIKRRTNLLQKEILLLKNIFHIISINIL